MYKTLFIDLEERFSSVNFSKNNEINPIFKTLDDAKKENLLEYSIIVIYQKTVNLEIISELRDLLYFHNIKILVFTDQLDKATKDASYKSGSDKTMIIPSDSEDLIYILSKEIKELEKSKKMNIELLHPFESSIHEIFSMMAFMNIVECQKYLTTSNFNLGDTTGIMSLSGEQRGFILISFEEKLARKMISNFIAVPEDQLEQNEVFDGVGEIINMVAGGAKARLSSDHQLFDLSAPFVIYGKDYGMHLQKDTPSAVMVYKADDQYFAVKLSMMALKKK